MNKTKVLVSANWFGITACAEYVVRALKRRTDVEVKTIGAFPGRSIAWANPSVLPEKYVFRPDYPLPAMPIGAEVPIQMISNQLKQFHPDMFIQVDAGFHFIGKIDNCINITILTDPHVLREYYNKVKSQYDIVFCTQTPYSVGGDEFYLPYAYDSEWHKSVIQDKIYDVMLIGNTYANRVDLMDTLSNDGIKTYFKLGIAKDDVTELMSQSLIGLNWSSLDDLTARVWEIMGCGQIPVINRVTDLQYFFKEDEDYLGFSTKQEAIDKIKMVLENPGMYYQTVLNYTKKLSLHTWDERVKTILYTSGFLKENEYDKFMA